MKTWMWIAAVLGVLGLILFSVSMVMAKGKLEIFSLQKGELVEHTITESFTDLV